jgi:hypothetical protein
MHNLQTLFQGQALQILERQDTALQQVLDRLAQLQTHKKDAVGVRRRSSPANVTHHSSCVRCTFLRNRVQALRKGSCPILTWKQGISHACLACAKIWRGMSHRRQPTFRIDLLEKRLLLPGMLLGYVLRQFQTDDRVLTGTYISNDYQYLEAIIVKWHEDTVPVYVKALPCQSIPNLELRVREFQPSRAFQPDVHMRWFDDDYGDTRELKSAPSPPSRSRTPCRFKHPHLASRVSQGERLMARVRAHPRSMGPKIDSLLCAILGFLLRNRFVSPLWIR